VALFRTVRHIIIRIARFESADKSCFACCIIIISSYSSSVVVNTGRYQTSYLIIITVND